MATPLRTLPPPLRLLAFASVPVVLIAVATVGYRLIEGWPWFDAFYTAVSTLTSIGASVHVPSKGGRAFTIFLALFGIFTVALAATEVLSTIVTGELRGYLEKRRMDKRIATLEKHVIICGYGRVGRYACAQLRGGEVPFVVVDRRTDRLSAACEAGALPIQGDASDDATLRAAGIERARALVAAASADADNVLITMTARLLNPSMAIVARAAEEETVPKLLRAGATRTISPYAIGGRRIALAVSRPEVLDLVEALSRSDLPDLCMEEQLVHASSPLDGETVGGSGLRTQLGLVLIAIKRRGGDITFNPGDDAALAAGDTLVILGLRDQLDRAERLAMSRSSGRAPRAGLD